MGGLGPCIQTVGTPWEVQIDGIQAQASHMAIPWDVPEWVIYRRIWGLWGYGPIDHIVEEPYYGISRDLQISGSPDILRSSGSLDLWIQEVLGIWVLDQETGIHGS
jgi:hypothetical protein